MLLGILCVIPFGANVAIAAGDDPLEKGASWKRLDTLEIATALRRDLDLTGVLPAEMDQAAEGMLAAIERDDVDPFGRICFGSRSRHWLS